MKTWRFTALDSLFFREARPFDSLGGSELSSVFPPSPMTLVGAIRSAIGDCSHQKVNWANYKDSPLEKQIGGSHSLGGMRIKGVFLSRNLKGLNDHDKWQRLYPVPAHLVIKDKTLHFLKVGKPVHCDLGEKVCLAVAPNDEKNETIKGIKQLENYWLTKTTFEKILNGSLPDLTELISASDLFKREAHLGIGRNNQHRTAKQGLLYQTQHIRPNLDLAIEVDIEGLEQVNYPTTGIVRLGGEGRGAAFEVIDKQHEFIGWAEARSPSLPNVKGIKLILISPIYVPQTKGYAPLPNFEKQEQDGETVWKGQINRIKLTLHCAIIGKTVREGGWDLQNRQPKPVRSFIPAGSVFYCTVDAGDITQLGQQINQQIDLDKALGRGLFAVCPWFSNDSEGNTK
jgi:CRISPR-associated protein Cmr3